MTKKLTSVRGWVRVNSHKMSCHGACKKIFSSEKISLKNLFELPVVHDVVELGHFLVDQLQKVDEWMEHLVKAGS